jgi:phytoene dehydrogenase-like protein
VTDAVVIGSGPNGLAAAVTMARAGLAVTVFEAQSTPGGGARTLPSSLADGLVHDVCSAVHPLASASPFFRRFDLRRRGVTLHVPEVSYAHPLAAEPAGIAYRSVERTAAALGRDGAAWRRLFEPLVRSADAFVGLALDNRAGLSGALLAPSALAAGMRAAVGIGLNATRAGDVAFRTPQARALLAGVGSHVINRVPSLAAASVTTMLATLAHSEGWAIPAGGSQAIVDALIADLLDHGGQVVTDHGIATAADLPPARVVLADIPPSAVARIWADELGPAARRRLTRFAHGNAAAKVDFVLSGPVPWADERVGEAATVHVAGDRAELAAAELAVHRGAMPERPVVLFSDPAVADAGRIVGGLRPGWAYAHVPAHDPRDVTDAVVRQIERFAPGFRDVVVASSCTPAARMHEHNANLIGGDISGGSTAGLAFALRPRLALDPYATGIEGVLLCSSSTPPGPGVHGMSGWIAARRALRDRFGIRDVDLSPHVEARA